MWALGPVLTAGVNADYDPYYDKVVLLLRATGANASTNTVDESPHGHTVTVAGNAAVSTTQSVNGGTSYSLDGTGDFLSLPYNAACFDFPAGTDFTIEMWFYPTGDITDRTLISCYQNASTGWSLSIDPNSKPYFNCTGDGIDVQGSVPIVANRWYHIAVCREGTSLRLYMDGELIGLAVDGSNLSSGASDLYVGRLSASLTTYDWPGYIDDVRITKGVARYGLPAVAPAPSELSAGDACVLNFDGTDAATSTTDLASKTWTFYGNAQLDTAQSRYGSASLLLDGSGDYLQREASGGLPSGNSNYSISLWLRTTAALHDGGLISWGNWGTANAVTGLSLKAGGTISHFWWSNDLSGTISLNDGLWHHVMATFDGTVRKIWVDGRVLAADKPTSHNVANETQAVIGRSSTTLTDYFNGRIDAIRVTTNVLSLKAFTPAALKFLNTERSAKSDVVRHNFNADPSGYAYDHEGRRWTFAGNATLSATQSRTSGYSLYCDGSGDWLTHPSHSDFDLGDTYTVECWVYPTSVAGNFGIFHRGYYETGGQTWSGLTCSIRWLTTPELRVYFYATAYANEQVINVANALSANTWTHIAVVRDGTTGYVFINGICRGIKTGLNSSAASTRDVYIGGWNYSGGTESMPGYIDGLRITKGVARYTPQITVSQPGVESHADILVCDFEGTNGDTAYTDLTGRRWTFNGNAQLSTTQVKFGTTSLALDGNGDYLTSADYAGFAFGTGDFSVDWWMYKSANGSANYDTVIDTSGNGNATGGWFIEASSTRGVVLCRESVIRVQYNVSPNESAWVHWCVMRRNGQLYILRNGVQVATAADSASYAAAQMNIGRNGSNTYFFNGYIDALRVTKGLPRLVDYRPGPYASWHTSFDLLRDSVNTHMRGHGANNGTTIVDETGKTWTRSNVTTSTTTARWNGSSLYFAGTGYLIRNSDSSFATGTTDFTWEAWVYAATTGAWSRLLETSPYNSAAQGWHISFNGTDGAGSRRVGVQLAKSGGGGTRLESDAAFPNNTWTHVAFTRESNVGRLWINGTPQSTTLDLSAENWQVQSMCYGATTDTFSNLFTGYMNDIRMTTGKARYSVAAPTAATPKVVGTTALLSFDGTHGATSFTDAYPSNTWTFNGGCALSNAQTKFSSTSLLLDGVDDSVSCNNRAEILANGDYTVEAWVYVTATPDATYGEVLASQDDASNGWLIRVTSTGVQLVYPGLAASAATGGNISLNTWYHVCVGRRGTQHYIYVNGAGGAVSLSNRTADAATTLYIGRSTSSSPAAASGWFNGHIAHFRIVRGRFVHSNAPPENPFPRWKK